MFPSYSFSLSFLLYFSYQITPSNFYVLKFQRYYFNITVHISPFNCADKKVMIDKE